MCLEYYEHEFMELVTACPAVVCCRCSPEQKAQVVRLIRQHTKKRTAAIGDGGNDVSMVDTLGNCALRFLGGINTAVSLFRSKRLVSALVSWGRKACRLRWRRTSP